jgi:hypothetical protein
LSSVTGIFDNITNNDQAAHLISGKEVVFMKRLVIVLIILTFTAGFAFASGGKNHGTTGQGTTNTGSTSQGAGTQSQTGR